MTDRTWLKIWKERKKEIPSIHSVLSNDDTDDDDTDDDDDKDDDDKDDDDKDDDDNDDNDDAIQYER